MKKVLITGGAGFIGANLVRKLVSLPGFEVFIIEKKNTNLWRLKDIADKINIKYVDLEDRNRLSKVIDGIKPNIVFHLASYGVYPAFQNDSSKMVDINIKGTLNLADSLKKYPILSFVNVGTCFEYKEKKSKINENDALSPLNFYAVTKLAAELFLKNFAEANNMPIVNLRLFTPYGCYEASQRLIPYIILSALKNKKIELASPDTVRDFIFIEDVIDLFLKIIKNSRKYQGEIFNVGSGKHHSVKNVVDVTEKLLGKKLDVKYGKASYYRKDFKFFSANNAKAKAAFNWQIKYDLESGIGKSIDWFLKNRKLYS
jgi:nucleoside-diphosphate-sugar epimerase